MTRYESPSGTKGREQMTGPKARLRVVAATVLAAAVIGVCVAPTRAQQPVSAAKAGLPGTPTAPPSTIQVVPSNQPVNGVLPGILPIQVPKAASPAGYGQVVPAAAPTAPGVAQPAPLPTAPGVAQPVPLNPGTQPGPLSGPLSNPLLSPGPQGLTASPVLTPETREKLKKYVEKLIDPETTLDIVSGQTRVLVFKGQPFRVQAGDDSVLAVNVITQKELLLQGKAVGATVLNVWFGDPADPTKQETLTYLVRVFPDPEAKERLERAYKALEDDINRYFKDTSIKLKIVGDKLLVSGRVRDYIQGGQVLQIIRANMNAGGEIGRLPIVPAGGVEDPTGATNTPTAESFISAGGPGIINLLEVAGEQQVMLRVLVAEVNRAASRSIGMNFSVTNNQGITVFRNTTAGLGGLAINGNLGGGFGAGGFGLGGGANLFAAFDAGKIPVALNALKTMTYARSLAEPTLVTMNGVPANFLAGGQFPVPVVAGLGGAGFGGGLQGVQFVPYGVQLNFTPFITDRDRVRLVLNANVSARDNATGANIGGANVAGLNTRNVSTTVELRQGETIAVAGLIEYSIGADKQQIPFIGDIPGLNSLTGMTRTTSGEKELVIFITPELVRPIDPNQCMPLPGHEILDPNDVEFYLLNRIEGHHKDFRSPIRTDLSRLKQYIRTETHNVFGPTGYTPIP